MAPDPGEVEAARPATGLPAPLQPEQFHDDDLAAINHAGGVFAATIADISHHHIGGPGG